jgi:hypothetical protein
MSIGPTTKGGLADGLPFPPGSISRLTIGPVRRLGPWGSRTGSVSRGGPHDEAVIHAHDSKRSTLVVAAGWNRCHHGGRGTEWPPGENPRETADAGSEAEGIVSASGQGVETAAGGSPEAKWRIEP